MYVCVRDSVDGVIIVSKELCLMDEMRLCGMCIHRGILLRGWKKEIC